MNDRMTDKPLWKVISLSKRNGSRISKSLPYNAALRQFHEFRKEIMNDDLRCFDQDKLYMVQVLEVHVGRAPESVSTMEEIEITASLTSTYAPSVPERKEGFDALRRVK